MTNENKTAADGGIELGLRLEIVPKGRRKRILCEHELPSGISMDLSSITIFTPGKQSSQAQNLKSTPAKSNKRFPTISPKTGSEPVDER